MSMKYWWNDTW